MCYIIETFEGKDLQGKRDFLACFGELPDGDTPPEHELDVCFCNYDLEHYFESKGIEFEKNYGLCLYKILTPLHPHGKLSP